MAQIFTSQDTGLGGVTLFQYTNEESFIEQLLNTRLSAFYTKQQSEDLFLRKISDVSLNMNGFRITNLSNPVDLSDAVNLGYLESELSKIDISLSLQDVYNVGQSIDLSAGTLSIKDGITSIMDISTEVVQFNKPVDVSGNLKSFYLQLTGDGTLGDGGDCVIEAADDKSSSLKILFKTQKQGVKNDVCQFNPNGTADFFSTVSITDELLVQNFDNGRTLTLTDNSIKGSSPLFLNNNGQFVYTNSLEVLSGDFNSPLIRESGVSLVDKYARLNASNTFSENQEIIGTGPLLEFNNTDGTFGYKLQAGINNVNDLGFFIRDKDFNNLAIISPDGSLNVLGDVDISGVYKQQGQTLDSKYATISSLSSVEDDVADVSSQLNSLESDVNTNTSNISTNTSNISSNTSNISTNTSNISSNSGSIIFNAQNISSNTGRITTLENENFINQTDGDARYLKLSGGTITGQLKVNDNGENINLIGTDHVYMSFYPEGFNAGRKGYIGFPSNVSTELTIKNEHTGGVVNIYNKIKENGTLLESKYLQQTGGTLTGDLKLPNLRATNSIGIGSGNANFGSGFDEGWLLLHHRGFDGNIGDEFPNPDSGVLITAIDSANTLQHGHYFGLVKDVASTSSTTSYRLDFGTISPADSLGTNSETETFNPNFTIDGGGNVGIGTTTPSSKLEVNGDILTGGLELTERTNGGEINARDAYLLLQRDEEHPIELWGTQIESRKNHYFGGSSKNTVIDTGGNLKINDASITINTGFMSIINPDTQSSVLFLHGENQGTGRLFVGQSDQYGGGIEYNGDNSPTTTGAGSDYITLWRRDNFTDSWTARNRYNSPDWEFRNNVFSFGNVRSRQGSDHAQLTYFGVEFNRGSSYLRPTLTDATATLYVGYAPGNQRWKDIFFDSIHSTFKGDVYINTTEDVNTTGESGALVIGSKSSFNMGLDGNEIMARNGNSAANLFLQAEGGRVGINDLSPRCPLEVTGSVSVGGYSVYISENTNGNAFSTSTEQTSIYCNSGVGCSYISFHSDERIKRNIVPIDDERGLELVRQIEAYDYQYKDRVAKGDTHTLGFIAQQVREVLPNAVTITHECIPNIYRNSRDFSWCQITPKKQQLTIYDISFSEGKTYEFIVSNDISGENVVVKKECISGNSFIFKRQYAYIFVYGEEVDDFHTVDKHKIYALHHSAIQQLDKNQRKLRGDFDRSERYGLLNRIQQLESDNAKLRQEMEEYKQSVDHLIEQKLRHIKWNM